MPDLFLRPTDVLVFRDGRPFQAGADRLATGSFPPLPTTLYGALRAYLLGGAGADFRHLPDFGLEEDTLQVLGDAKRIGSLAVRALTLARQTGRDAVEALYPWPQDLLRAKSDIRALALARPTENLPMASDLPMGLAPLLPPKAGRTIYEGGTGFLTAAAMEAVLAGQAPTPENLLREEEVFKREPRTSVQLNSETRTAADGQLFTVDFVRLHEDIGFYVRLDAGALEVPEAGVLTLGGERRPARIESGVKAQGAAAPTVESNRVKLVLTTPAPLADGWRLPGLTDTHRLRLGGTDAQLVGAAVGRPVRLGGWDVAQGRPRDARPSAPAGSVYFLLTASPEDARDLQGALDGSSLFSNDSPEARSGLGLVRVGIW